MFRFSEQVFRLVKVECAYTISDTGAEHLIPKDHREQQSEPTFRRSDMDTPCLITSDLHRKTSRLQGTGISYVAFNSEKLTLTRFDLKLK
jgi:hypothetical protein